MRKLCVGIDVAKSKFDVMYTIDGENYFGYSTFPNDKKGIKKFVKQAEKFLKNVNKYIFAWKQQEYTTASFVNIFRILLIK